MYMKSQYPSTQKSSILVERTYKLKNFDMNLKAIILAVTLLDLHIVRDLEIIQGNW